MMIWFSKIHKLQINFDFEKGSRDRHKSNETSSKQI